METLKLNTTVKNGAHGYGVIQDKALKAIVGQKVTVTIDADEGTEVTTPVKPSPVVA